mmetsp:Transcript_30260/g.56526  ORF Transcript_30260/g.56526 Transcript_30260/m.56526 type:complete len:118 (+) Transcript_30260:31-384(+)
MSLPLMLTTDIGSTKRRRGSCPACNGAAALCNANHAVRFGLDRHHSQLVLGLGLVVPTAAYLRERLHRRGLDPPAQQVAKEFGHVLLVEDAEHHLVPLSLGHHGHERHRQVISHAES